MTTPPTKKKTISELLPLLLEAHRAKPEQAWYATELLGPGFAKDDLLVLNGAYGMLAKLKLVELEGKIVMPVPGFCANTWKATAERAPLSSLVILERDVAEMLRPVTKCNNPELFQFAVSIFTNCLLKN